ncbi:hypothetical protein TRIUR3_24637 [Triticum urartu]|uniref:Uncharacterized protein n=1 Tax=Triticum urartu TaxID=4572 RepID=M7ZEM4_TRIUA|nr:hypothetical protein TRIUR3_24637 [Triticum urartu]
MAADGRRRLQLGGSGHGEWRHAWDDIYGDGFKGETGGIERGPYYEHVAWSGRPEAGRSSWEGDEKATVSDGEKAQSQSLTKSRLGLVDVVEGDDDGEGPGHLGTMSEGWWPWDRRRGGNPELERRTEEWGEREGE